MMAAQRGGPVYLAVILVAISIAGEPGGVGGCLHCCSESLLFDRPVAAATPRQVLHGGTARHTHRFFW